jgi:hypothetical protein
VSFAVVLGLISSLKRIPSRCLLQKETPAVRNPTSLNLKNFRAFRAPDVDAADRFFSHRPHLESHTARKEKK